MPNEVVQIAIAASRLLCSMLAVGLTTTTVTALARFFTMFAEEQTVTLAAFARVSSVLAKVLPATTFTTVSL